MPEDQVVKQKSKPTYLKGLALVLGIAYVFLFVWKILTVPPMPHNDASSLPSAALKVTDSHFIWYAIFTLAPPIWFSIEAALYGKGHGENEDFKHNQELI